MPVLDKKYMHFKRSTVEIQSCNQYEQQIKYTLLQAKMLINGKWTVPHSEFFWCFFLGPAIRRGPSLKMQFRCCCCCCCCCCYYFLVFVANRHS